MQYRMDRIVEAKITKYLDGDTIKVTLTNGFIITVRLLLIDCPEYKRLKIDQQLYGYEALEYAKVNRSHELSSPSALLRIDIA